MSSLFDDSFLADLQPSRAHEEEPPPPPEDGAPEPLPDDLFGGRFDVPASRDTYYRDGAHRPAVDPAALLDGLNENQRAAVVHSGSPLLIVAGAGPARPGCSRTGSRICWASAMSTPARSSRSPSRTRPRVR